MSRGILYPTDIQNAIRAAREANLATADAGEVSPEYLQGFNDALNVIALAFNLGRQSEPVRWPKYATLALDR